MLDRAADGRSETDPPQHETGSTDYRDLGGPQTTSYFLWALSGVSSGQSTKGGEAQAEGRSLTLFSPLITLSRRDICSPLLVMRTQPPDAKASSLPQGNLMRTPAPPFLSHPPGTLERAHIVRDALVYSVPYQQPTSIHSLTHSLTPPDHHRSSREKGGKTYPS